MSAADQAIAAIEAELERRRARNLIAQFYPDAGQYRRELYRKHFQCFAAGKRYRERLFIAANRVGKTEGVGAFETTLHLTGDYPSWWPGHRFLKPISAWAAGDTNQTVKEIIQYKLLGMHGNFGTGMIPADRIVGTPISKAGVPQGIEKINVRTVYGKGDRAVSELLLKSYDQGREAFQGTEKDWIWEDEEAPEDIHQECLIRTTETGRFKGGKMLLTFTPLRGLSPLVLTFLPTGKIVEGEVTPSRHVTSATWWDVPHLSDETRTELLASIHPHFRDARSRGIPMLGSGAIYPIPEELITVDDFRIPDDWVRGYAMDVGWRFTAAVFKAISPDGTGYLYSCYKGQKAEPPIHASAIKARGNLEGFIDPASCASSQVDGRKLIELYRREGLRLHEAQNAVEAGIDDVWRALSTGRLKVFRSMAPWFEEYRVYRRDEKGRIVKDNDHLMDCTRYRELAGMRGMRKIGGDTDQPERDHRIYGFPTNRMGWAG